MFDASASSSTSTSENMADLVIVGSMSFSYLRLYLENRGSWRAAARRAAFGVREVREDVAVLAVQESAKTAAIGRRYEECSLGLRRARSYINTLGRAPAPADAS